MKYVNLIFGSLPRIMYAHECTIKDLNGQPRSNGYFELTFVEQGEMNVKSARLETDCKIGAGEFFFAPVGVEYEASTKGELKHSCAAFFSKADTSSRTKERLFLTGRTTPFW